MTRFALVAVALALLLGGCASRQASAPVVDRTPARAPAPKPPVAQPAPVPGAPAGAQASPSGTYQVKRGDTLYSIALDQGQDHRDLARWNKLGDANRIQAGQVLRVTPPEAEQGVQVGAARGAGAVESRPIESRPLESRPAEAKPAAQAAGVKTEPKALRLPYSPENVAMLQKNDPG
ncbi:unnamed protein product, partial [Phaeothamnion confervicola]